GRAHGPWKFRSDAESRRAVEALLATQRQDIAVRPGVVSKNEGVEPLRRKHRARDPQRPLRISLSERSAEQILRRHLRIDRLPRSQPPGKCHIELESIRLKIRDEKALVEGAVPAEIENQGVSARRGSPNVDGCVETATIVRSNLLFVHVPPP